MASIAISSDGGIIVAPANVPGQGWQYAVSRSAGCDDPIEISQVEERPKLHYHRSGVASITLTGHELERRGMRLSPVAETTGGQILSIVAIRPWELAVRESRKGDIATVHDKWPGDVTFMFQLVRYAKALPALDGVHEALSPLRLLQFDDSRFAVDMTAYLPNTLLVGLTAYHSNPSDFHHPSVTVAALPWSPDRSEADRQGALALWSSSLRNPLVAHARPEDVLSGEEIASRIGSGAFRIESVDATTDRLFGARRSDRGST